MKVSIITITRNDGELLNACLASIYKQIGGDSQCEHIIVESNDVKDSLSEGNGNPLGINSELREEIRKRGVKVIHAEPKGCYNAINIGLTACSGDIIGLLNGTDYFANDHVLADVVETMTRENADFLYADAYFVDKGKITRRYSSSGFESRMLMEGFAPPHPTLFITRKTLERVGFYKEDYRIAADFDYFIRLFYNEFSLKACRLPKEIVALHAGGMSQSLRSR